MTGTLQGKGAHLAVFGLLVLGAGAVACTVPVTGPGGPTTTSTVYLGSLVTLSEHRTPGCDEPHVRTWTLTNGSAYPLHIDLVDGMSPAPTFSGADVAPGATATATTSTPDDYPLFVHYTLVGAPPATATVPSGVIGRFALPAAHADDFFQGVAGTTKFAEVCAPTTTP